MHRSGRLILGLALFAMAAVAGTGPLAASSSQVLADGLGLDFAHVAGGFERPTFVTSARDGTGRLYVLEKMGRIYVINGDGVVDPQPLLDLSDRVVARVNGEQGLFSLAFHPDFISNGRLYISYTRAPDGALIVAQHIMRDGRVDLANELEIIVVPQPFSQHNGGMIAFDASGMLLIGVGDGGWSGRPQVIGQDDSPLLGKLLRIDVDVGAGAGAPYVPAADNGLADDGHHQPEVHSRGLRNPWRFSVDRDGGHIYIGDVGNAAWEEINVLPHGLGGQDFGWFHMEGPECFRARDCEPAFYSGAAITYPHQTEAEEVVGCAVVGGYAYRGSEQPRLQDVYVFGDFCTGTIWGASATDMLTGSAEAHVIGTLESAISSFGEDDAGEILVVDYTNGSILRLLAR